MKVSRYLRNQSQRLDLPFLALKIYFAVYFLTSYLGSVRNGKILDFISMPHIGSDLDLDFIAEQKTIVNLSLEGIIVVDSKDFITLPTCVDFFEKATRNFSSRKLVIVTPDSKLSRMPVLPDLPNCEIVIRTDESIIGDELISRIRCKFGSRSGWVIQQIVKLAAVHYSEAELNLLLDADTFLIRERFLFDEIGKVQALFPSMEQHKPYYDFLRSVKLISTDPEFSFVTHHMLIQKEIFELLFVSLGVSSPADIAELILNQTWPESESSPFSIDYELYAQFLYFNFPERFRMTKWSNFELSGVSSDVDFAEIGILLRNRYASISVHSYNRN